MTQVVFALAENNPNIHLKLNQAVQGHRFLRRSVFTGLSEPKLYACHERIAALHARLLGPGGGGAGAAAGTASDASAGSGGGAGGYYDFFTTDSVLLRNQMTIIAPPGGAAGLAGGAGNTQSSGAAITFQGPLSTVIVAKAGGGQGGIPIAPGISNAIFGGGAGGIVFNRFATPYDVFQAGEVGGAALRILAPLAGPQLGTVNPMGGHGGNSKFGGGGRALVGTAVNFSGIGAPGEPASSYGAGGGGARAYSSGGHPGGPGGSAVIIMDEYY